MEQIMRKVLVQASECAKNLLNTKMAGSGLKVSLVLAAPSIYPFLKQHYN